MKKIKLNLVGIDGNAFVIMGHFQRAARRQGWDAEEIKAVFDKAMDSDYNNLLATISEYCEAEDE